MSLTTYRVDFFATPEASPASLTIVTNRFDTVTHAIRYHLIKHLGTNPALISYTMNEGIGYAHQTTDISPAAPLVAKFTFRTTPGPTDVEVGANAELAGTTHCPACGSPEWNAVNVKCEDCAAEVEKYDGLLDILDEFDVHVVDEVDDNPERNPHVGFVPAEKSELPERLMAWRDAAVKVAVAKESSHLNRCIEELEADLERRWLNSLGDVTISAGFGTDAISVTVYNAEWAQLESHWQLAGWIREPAEKHWAIHEADQITVAYNPEASGDPNILLESVDLLRHATPGTRYGDGRGAFTRFAAKRRPKRFGGES